MKKVILIAFLGMFVFAAATSFAVTVNTQTTAPIAQFDDDPNSEEKTECDAEKKKECEKKCDKTCEKKCCKAEKHSCSGDK